MGQFPLNSAGPLFVPMLPLFCWISLKSPIVFLKGTIKFSILSSTCYIMARSEMLDYIRLWASLVAQIVKNLPEMWERPGFNLWVEKIPWRRAWQHTQDSYLENPMDRGAWQATFQGVAKSRTQLNDWTHILDYTVYRGTEGEKPQMVEQIIFS